MAYHCARVAEQEMQPEANNVFQDNKVQYLSRWLISLRWFIIFCELLIAITISILLPETVPVAYLLSIVLSLSALNAVFMRYCRRFDHEYGVEPDKLKFFHVQIIIDLILFTFFLHFIGGMETPVFVFYLVYTVIVCFIFTTKVSIIYVSFMNLLYISLLLLEGLGIIPHYNLIGFRVPGRFREPIHIIAVWASLVLSSSLIAYFATNIVNRLRVREKELIESNLVCELKTKELQEMNLACELKTKELAEANLSCELKTRELEQKTKELAELNQRLEELDKARTQFIWLVTHELRAPIAGIQSYLRLILDGYVPPEKHMDIIARTERLARRHLDLITDLLELAKLREPKALQNSELTSVNVAEVLDSIQDVMTAQCAEKAINYIVEVETEIQPIIANKEHIKHLLTNLIGNAVKYTNPGGSVFVSLSQDVNHVIGVVRDTGIGIPPEDLPHIFDDFFRAKNAKSTQTDGTGLGLAIVKRIIDTYKGEISVESELGKGTKFTFKLPKNVMLTAEQQS